MTADTLHPNDILPQSTNNATTNNAHNRRLTKNEKRRLKKKGHSHDQDHESSSESKQQDENQNSSNHLHESNGSTNPKTLLPPSSSSQASKKPATKNELEEIEVEYVSATDYLEKDPLFKQFENIFSKFTKPEELLSAQTIDKHNLDDLFPVRNKAQLTSTDQGATDSSTTDLTAEEGPKKLSKKKKKLLSRLSVAELKQLVTRPDVVEAHDISSSDPRLLVVLKGCRNTVPVPRHWCHIRKYLQGKRGIEKIPFQLPEFIAETGIAKIRETVMEQEALKKSKQKQRERIRPKMGKIDIDYQVLHDAFFKYQTKPKMTIHGDLYYEGKEFEVIVLIFFVTYLLLNMSFCGGFCRCN
jgi:splicing factor 3B subunit 2